jgi:hypothetical protein
MLEMYNADPTVDQPLSDAAMAQLLEQLDGVLVIERICRKLRSFSSSS